MSGKSIISIDLGGTKVLSALINSNNEIVMRKKIPTDMSKGNNNLVRITADAVNEIFKDSGLSEKNIRAVCVGVPGTVSPISGIISNAPNLGITHFNIKEAFSKYFHVPILIENDVNLAGLGIKKFETSEDSKNMIVVFVGTGIGSALFFEGKIYRGSTFYAGEIGHILIEQNGSLSAKSKKKTLELLASRTAIVKSIKKDLKKGKKSILYEFKSPNKILKSKSLANAVKQNDPIAVKHVKKASVILGATLGSVTTLLNLDTIVLGGGVIEAMHSFMVPEIRSAFKNVVIPDSGKHVKILSTKLGDDAALYGGVALAEEFLG